MRSPALVAFGKQQAASFMHALQNVCARVSPFVVVDKVACLEHLYVINHIAEL